MWVFMYMALRTIHAQAKGPRKEEEGRREERQALIAKRWLVFGFKLSRLARETWYIEFVMFQMPLSQACGFTDGTKVHVHLQLVWISRHVSHGNISELFSNGWLRHYRHSSTYGLHNHSTKCRDFAHALAIVTWPPCAHANQTLLDPLQTQFSRPGLLPCPVSHQAIGISSMQQWASTTSM